MVHLTEINNIIINNAYVQCISFSHKELEDALKNFEYKSPSEIFKKLNIDTMKSPYSKGFSGFQG